MSIIHSFGHSIDAFKGDMLVDSFEQEQVDQNIEVFTSFFDELSI